MEAQQEAVRRYLAGGEYRRGRQDNVKVETLRSLAAALGCATVDLMPEEDKRQRSLAKI